MEINKIEIRNFIFDRNFLVNNNKKSIHSTEKILRKLVNILNFEIFFEYIQ